MDILLGLIAGVAIAFTLFNKSININISHTHTRAGDNWMPKEKEDTTTEQERLEFEATQKRMDEATKAYGSVMGEFMGVEVIGDE